MAGTETITLRLVAQDLMSGNVTKAISGLDNLAKRGGLVGSVMQGVGQSFGQMLNPIGLVTKGIGMMTDVLGDSLRAWQEDQKSQLQLRAALEANVESWDGNTDAIERTIDARTRLGFADDEQRASLSQLLVVTENVSEALKIQRTAMDLSRLKGISLADAAKALGNAYSGATAQLAKMGIRLGKGVSGMEALEAVQGRVFGQAEAYAQSSIGKMEALNIRVGELQEDIGALLVGPADLFVDWLGTVVDMIDGPDGADAQVLALAKSYRELGKATGDIVDPFQMMNEELDRIDKMLSQIGNRNDTRSGAFAWLNGLDRKFVSSLGIGQDALLQLASDMQKAGKTSEDFRRELYRLQQDNVAGANVLSSTWGAMSADFDSAFSSMMRDWDALMARPQVGAKWADDLYRFLTVNLDGIRSNWEQVPDIMQQELIDAGLVAEDFGGEIATTLSRPVRRVPEMFMEALSPLVEITKGTLQQAKQTARREMAELAWALKHPMADSNLEKVWRNELQGAYKVLHKAEDDGNRIAIAKAQSLIDRLKAKLAQLDSARFELLVSYSYTHPSGDAPVGNPPAPPRRRGGPVSAGRTYLVGEEGPELLTMGSSSGHVTPNTGGGVHVHLHGLLSAPTEAETSRIARTLGPAIRREMAAAGM